MAITPAPWLSASTPLPPETRPLPGEAPPLRAPQPGPPVRSPAIDPIEAEIMRREALARGETVTEIGGETRIEEQKLRTPAPYPTPTTPVEPLRIDAFTGRPEGERSQFQRDFGIYPGPTPGVPIPPEARDPVQLEIERREAISRPAKDPQTWVGRLDTALIGVLPPNLREKASALGRIGANFNEALARAAGMPFDAVDEAMRGIGVGIWEKPGAATRTIRKVMNDVGIPTSRTRDLEGQLGRGLFDGLATTAAFFAAAPYMIAKGGATTAGAFSRALADLGKYAQKAPAAFTAQNVGASFGATVAEEEVGGPWATMAGAAAGSLLPGALGTVAKGVTYPIRAAARMIRGEGPLPPPIVAPGTRTGPARDFAKTEHEAQMGRLDAERTRIIEREGGPMGTQPSTAQSVFEEQLTAAERSFRREMQARYQPYEGTQVDPSITVNRMARLMRDVEPSELAGPNFPTEWTQRIQGLYVRQVPAAQPPAAVPFGQPLPTPQPAQIQIVPTTLGDLINLRSDILRAAANARRGAAGTPANAKQAAYLSRLAEGVQENIEAAVAGTPAEQGVREASQFARHFYDLFERGIVGRTWAPETGRREAAVAPEALVERMLQQGRVRSQDAFSQVTQMADLPPVGIGHYQTLDAAEQAVRALFRQAAEKHPLGAERWFAANRKAIGSLARVANDLEAASSRITQIHTIERQEAKNAVAKFVGADEQNAYARLYSAADPAADAKRLMVTMKLDPDALKGFRAGVVDHLLFATGGSGSQMKALMGQPKVDRMLREVLEPDAYARLSRIAELGSRLEGGDKTLGARLSGAGVPIIFRIMGAQAGTTIAHIVGRGNIQTPAIVSGIMRNWASDLFKGISPQELVTRAVLDARWEKVLMERVPSNLREMRAFQTKVRRLIWVSQGATQPETSPEDFDE